MTTVAERAQLEHGCMGPEPDGWRLMVRYERRADILQAFMHLACAMLCTRRPNSLPQS
jgi:hypothetical protein